MSPLGLLESLRLTGDLETSALWRPAESWAKIARSTWLLLYGLFNATSVAIELFLTSALSIPT